MPAPNPATVARAASEIAGLSPRNQSIAIELIIGALRDYVVREGWSQEEQVAFVGEFIDQLVAQLHAHQQVQVH